MRNTFPPLAVLLFALPIVGLNSQAVPPASVDIRHMMSASQFEATGLRKLADSEIVALNTWLGEFLMKLMTASDATATPSVIESQIDGEFEGWDGDTIFKLMNGQIWQQSSYHYNYHFAYMPKVIIYRSGPGYKMKVDGVDQTISVRRLR